MASLQDKVMARSAGWPDATNTVIITVTGTTATDTLEANSTYRVISTQDCFINIEASATAATSSHMLVLAGIPEVFSTNATAVEVSAIRLDTDGSLYLTKLDSTPL